MFLFQDIVNKLFCDFEITGLKKLAVTMASLSFHTYNSITITADTGKIQK